MNDNWVADIIFFFARTIMKLLFLPIVLILALLRRSPQDASNAMSLRKMRTYFATHRKRALSVTLVAFAISTLPLLIVTNVIDLRPILTRLHIESYEITWIGDIGIVGIIGSITVFIIILITPAVTVYQILARPNIYLIRMPAGTKWNTATTSHFISQLLRIFPTASLEITANEQNVSWRIIDHFGVNPNTLDLLVRSSYPNAIVEKFNPDSNVVSLPIYRSIGCYEQVNMFVAPIKRIDELVDFDPLSALTQMLSELRNNEQVIYALAITEAGKEIYEQGVRLITQSTIHPLQLLSQRGMGDALEKKLAGVDRIDKYVRQDQSVLEGKLRQNLFRCCLVIQTDADSPERSLELLGLIDTHLNQYTRMPFNGLSFSNAKDPLVPQLITTPEQKVTTEYIQMLYQWIEESRKSTVPDMILDIQEIAALWHMPHQDLPAPRISWAKTIVDVSDVIARSRDGVAIGTGRYTGKQVSVCILPKDRVTHINIIGKTGTGKSTLMHRLIHEDIQRGEGIAVIDPHGNLIQDILYSSIPREREQDVISVNHGLGRNEHGNR